MCSETSPRVSFSHDLCQAEAVDIFIDLSKFDVRFLLFYFYFETIEGFLLRATERVVFKFWLIGFLKLKIKTKLVLI